MTLHALPHPLVMVTVNLRAQEYKPSPDLEALHVPFDRFSISMCATGSSTIELSRAIATA